MVQTALLPLGWGRYLWGWCASGAKGREHEKKIKGMLTLLLFLHILPKELGVGKMVQVDASRQLFQHKICIWDHSEPGWKFLSLRQRGNNRNVPFDLLQWWFVYTKPLIFCHFSFFPRVHSPAFFTGPAQSCREWKSNEGFSERMIMMSCESIRNPWDPHYSHTVK